MSFTTDQGQGADPSPEDYGNTFTFLVGNDIILISHSLVIDVNSLSPNSDLNWRKVWKTTRPFRYNLNQTPYDYTVEVTNRFKGLGLIDRVPEELWMELRDTVQTGGSDQDYPQEKEMQKGKMVVWGGLTNSCEKNRSEKQRRKGKIYPFECRVPKNSKE